MFLVLPVQRFELHNKIFGDNEYVQGRIVISLMSPDRDGGNTQVDDVLSPQSIMEIRNPPEG